MRSQRRRTDIEAVGQRGEAPSRGFPVRIQDALHRAADEAGVAGDEERSHAGR